MNPQPFWRAIDIQGSADATGGFSEQAIFFLVPGGIIPSIHLWRWLGASFRGSGATPSTYTARSGIIAALSVFVGGWWWCVRLIVVRMGRRRGSLLVGGPTGRASLDTLRSHRMEWINARGPWVVYKYRYMSTRQTSIMYQVPPTYSALPTPPSHTRSSPLN